LRTVSIPVALETIVLQLSPPDLVPLWHGLRRLPIFDFLWKFIIAIPIGPIPRVPIKANIVIQANNVVAARVDGRKASRNAAICLDFIVGAFIQWQTSWPHAGPMFTMPLLLPHLAVILWKRLVYYRIGSSLIV
jgi:hypothetical protein